MLQSNWNLVEGAQELSRIDYAKAPRGVCLNRAPITRVLGASRGGGEVFTTSVGAPLSLFGSVHDEGLPRGKTLTTTWKQLSGPGTSTFENAGSARTHVTFSAPGAYELELTGTDSELSSSARIRVTVTR
jgi:hypothetical protein